MNNNLKSIARLSELQMSQLIEHHLGDTFYYLENKGVFVFYFKDEGWIEENEIELRSKVFFQFLDTLGEVPSTIPEDKQEEWLKHRYSCIQSFSNITSVKNVFLILQNKRDFRKEELFNKEPHLFGVKNGIVNLKTGQLLLPSKQMKITQSSSVSFNPKAKAPRWERFIKEILPNHQDFIQKLMGYGLTGETNLQKMWLFVGNGRNGKSTFLENIMSVMGTSYSQKTPHNSIMSATATSSASPELTRMKNKRLIVLSETDLDAKLNETNVKQLTGGDTIVARNLYSGYDQFQIVGKFIMATNHLPRISSNDEAIWRRLEVIHFEAQFKHNTDPTLASTLLSEREGILLWLISGAKKYYASGRDLKPTSQMLDWVKEYRTEEDILSGFINDTVVEVQGAIESALNLYDSYKVWCKSNAITAIDQNQFGRGMTKRGYVRKKMGKAHTTNYLNIQIKKDGGQTLKEHKYIKSGKLSTGKPKVKSR